MFGAEFQDATEETFTESEPVIRKLGHFELLEEIARGGMGVVFRARHVGLNRMVAVKILGETWLATGGMVERFRIEAAAAARLKHPGIVAIHEVGCDDGVHYFAMDLIDGPNLAQATLGNPVSTERAIQLTAAIAEAVQHAHDRGLIHRDLKPSNVLLDVAGFPHVTDFGLARHIDDASSLTATGQILGTPGYMAPEQAEPNAMVGPAADVYGLGSILYHLLTGRAPFVGSGLAATLALVLRTDPVSPRLLNPAVSEDLAAVCLKCLNKEPARRYPSAADLAGELGRIRRGEPTLVRPAGSAERAWRWSRRNPALAASLGSVLVALVLGLAGTTWQWREARLLSSRLGLMAAKSTARSGRPGQQLQALQLLSGRGAEPVSPGAPQGIVERRSAAISALARLDLEPEKLEWRPGRDYEYKITLPTYAVSPRGDLMAWWVPAADDQAVVRIESLRPGGRIRDLSRFGRLGDELAFSPDGRLLAVHYYWGDEICVWEVATGTLLFHRPCQRNSDFSLEFSPDSTRLAVSGPDHRIHLHVVADGREDPPIEIGTPEVPARRARFSPDGTRLAVTAGSELVIWELATRRVLARESFTDWASDAVAWHPGGRDLAISLWQRPEIFLCDANLLSRRRVLNGGGAAMFQLMFSPTGDLLVGRGADGETRIWDLNSGELMLSTDEGLAGGFPGSGDRLVFDRQYQAIGVWHVRRSRILKTFRGETAALRPSPPAFSTDSEAVYWCSEQAAFRVDLGSGITHSIPEIKAVALVLDPTDGSLLTAGRSGLQRRRPEGGAVDEVAPQAMIGLARDHDGTTVAGITETNLIITGTRRRRISFEGVGAPCSVDLDPRGRWAAVGTLLGGGVVLDLATGNRVHDFSGLSCSVAFESGGRWLVSGATDAYRLWSTRDWKPRWARPRVLSTSKVAPLAVSPDGRWVAATLSLREISLLDPASGVELARLEAPGSAGIDALAFSPDSRRLAASRSNGCLQVWELPAIRGELDKLGLNWPDPPEWRP